MAQKKKNVKLRAFRIENKTFTKSSSEILNPLYKVLSGNISAKERSLKLNDQDDDEDLLSNFEWQADRYYLFGLMLRITPGENTGQISEELLSKKKFSIDDIENNVHEEKAYKESYYFAINDSYVVTNLSGTYTIDRLQTYINWLLESERKEALFSFTPVTVVPNGIKVEDIKSIEFGNNFVARTNSTNEDFSTRMKSLTLSAINTLFGEIEELKNFQNEQLVSAKLLLKIKRKPKEMKEEQYTKIMGAITKPLSDADGITIHTKKNGKFSGGEIQKNKIVPIEMTENNHLVEEQLKQEMEAFLKELNQ